MALPINFDFQEINPSINQRPNIEAPQPSRPQGHSLISTIESPFLEETTPPERPLTPVSTMIDQVKVMLDHHLHRRHDRLVEVFRSFPPNFQNYLFGSETPKNDRVVRKAFTAPKQIVAHTINLNRVLGLLELFSSPISDLRCAYQDDLDLEEFKDYLKENRPLFFEALQNGVYLGDYYQKNVDTAYLFDAINEDPHFSIEALEAIKTSWTTWWEVSLPSQETNAIEIFVG